MKKVLLMTVMVLALASFAVAQDAATVPVEKGLAGYGLKAGISLANSTGSDATAPAGVDKKMLLGLAGGVFVTYKFSPQLAIQPEALFVMKGVKYEAGSVKETFKLNYIEVPVLIKFMPAMSGNLKPSIFAGPYLGLRMTAKDKYEGFTAPLDSLNGETDVKDFTKSTDFGVSFGAGISYGLSKGAITFDIRYDLGLGKVPKDTPADNQKNSAIIAMLGFSLL